MPIVYHIDPSKPDELAIEKVISSLREGKVIIFPTETFYGLGVDIKNEKALEKIFSIKQRRPQNPLPVLIPDESFLKELTIDVPKMASILIERFWPGELTIVFRANSSVSSIISPQGKIGLRISSHPVALKITQMFHSPITCTSANLSGQSPSTAVEEIDFFLKERVDIIVDAGKTPGGSPSTVLDITCYPPRVLREGKIGIEHLKVYIPDIIR